MNYKLWDLNRYKQNLESNQIERERRKREFKYIVLNCITLYTIWLCCLVHYDN